MTNLILLGLEAVAYFAVMSLLFKGRHRFGIGMFFCALGTMHFLETYLAAVLYLQLPLGITISPGSIVLFSGKLVMLLLVFIREDAAVVRQPIYGLLFGNFLMVALVFLMRFHDLPPAVENVADFAFMGDMGGLMLWGSILLFIDSILIVLVYERSAAWLGERQLPRIVLSTALVLSFDQLGFYLALHTYIDAPLSVLYSGWIAKMGAAVVFGAMAAFYLRHVETARGGLVSRPSLSDVFDTLTYRQRYEALLKSSGRDSLTGLLNRGQLDSNGRLRIARAVAEERPISVLVIDVDYFKRLNDMYGHAAGDRVLAEIARRLAGAVRPTDLVFRYGGEEFVIIAEGLAYPAAMFAAERLRKQVSGSGVEGIDERITTSIGVATATGDGKDLDALFAAADQRLYAAKAAGRDRICGRPEPPHDQDGDRLRA